MSRGRGKRNVDFIRPEDPAFLKIFKEQGGYKEGPNVNTKRQKISDEFEDDDNAPNFVESEEEKPQVVVLNDGDLTETEAEIEQKKIEREEATKPADLSEKIIFKPRAKPKRSEDLAESSSSRGKDSSKKKKHKDDKSSQSKLSFGLDDDDEEGEEQDDN